MSDREVRPLVSLAEQLVAAEKQSGVVLPSQQDYIEPRPVGIVCLQMGLTPTVDALKETNGLIIIGPSQRFECVDEASWGAGTEVYGWRYHPFTFENGYIRDEGRIEPYRVMKVQCSGCDLSRHLSRKSVLDQTADAKTLTCRRCGHALQQVDPLQSAWRTQVYEAWGDSHPRRTPEILPRVWGLYTVDSGMVTEYPWAPANNDSQAIELSAEAATKFKCVIRPLPIIRREQQKARAENRQSQLMSLLLEARNTWHVGFLNLRDLTSKVHGFYSRFVHMPRKDRRVRGTGQQFIL